MDPKPEKTVEIKGTFKPMSQAASDLMGDIVAMTNESLLKHECTAIEIIGVLDLCASPIRVMLFDNGCHQVEMRNKKKTKGGE